MSKRGTKRATGRTDEPGPSKRRRVEQDDPLWNLRPVSDLKVSSIYNRSASDAPAELFRKDLISAMKLPDSEPLATNEYWVINDSWKQEWERGVQVPVNPDSLPAPTVEKITIPAPPGIAEFKLPKHKYVRLARDANFQSDRHQLSSAIARAESACSYDLDTTDSSWLVAFNGERARSGVQLLSEDQFERVIEELELRCWDKIQAILKSEEGLGIEYDENVICDVCRSPDSEEGNEMVFCDSCNICVHQACYGITSIPAGQWLCRPCGDGVKPVCVLCPNAGGAMKCTPSGHKWAHVSCVLWIPEVSIGCAEKMEPITKISSIPPSRWSLICVLCKERTGACIQCSVKTCKIAYHVTCAFKHGLEMRAIIEDENADDGVKLRSYCNKHSVNKKDKNQDKKESGSEEEEVKSKKRRKEMTSEEKKEARATRLQEIESEFHRQVSVKDISSQILGIDQDAISHIYNYWKVKRRAGHNRPLLPPKADDTDILSNRQEQADLDKMKMFVQLRQDLERVRNLCYMVSRREKLSRSFFRLREQTFHKQATVLTSIPKVDFETVKAVISANHGPSLYDQLYSHPKAEFSKDFQVVLSRIAGRESSDVEDVDKESTPVKSPQPSTSNPYRKVYTGTSARRSRSVHSNSTYSEDSGTEQKEKIRPAQTYRRPIYSSTEEDDEPPKAPTKKKNNQVKEKGDSSIRGERKKPRTAVQSKSVIDSSTEEDTQQRNKKEKSYIKSPPNKTLLKMQKEMSPRQSGSDSEDFMTIRTSFQKNKITDIYSDSSDTSGTVKQDMPREGNAPNVTPGADGQQHSFRTKAAVKEFIPTVKESPKPVRRNRKPSAKAELIVSCEEDKQAETTTLGKIKEYSSELIVPQRKAAKKASENMRSTTVARTKDTDPPSDTRLSFSDEPRVKSKSKSRTKDSIKDSEKDRKDSASANEFEPEKEDKDSQDILAYVPQRQAAKKAAEHIKSNMGTKPADLVNQEDGNKKKEPESAKPEPTKKVSPKKDGQGPKSPIKSSSSSSSSSSTSSYTSSSSSEDEEESSNTTGKVLSEKPSTSMFSPPRVRKAVLDLPFLDKVSRPLSSSSSSDIELPKEAGKHRRTPSPCRPYQKKSDTDKDAEETAAGISPAKITDKPFKSQTSSPQKTPDKSIRTSSSHLSKATEKAAKSRRMPDKQNKEVTDFQKKSEKSKPSDKSKKGNSITPPKTTDQIAKANNASEFKASEKHHRGSNETDKITRGAFDNQTKTSEKSQKGATEVSKKGTEKHAKSSTDTTTKSSEKSHKRFTEISLRNTDQSHKRENSSPPNSTSKCFKAASVFYQKTDDKPSESSTVSSQKIADKKYPSSERRSNSGNQLPSTEREEPHRSSHAKSHSSSRPRARGSASGRDLFDKQYSKHRKSSIGETGSSAPAADTKETVKSSENSHKKRKIHKTDIDAKQSKRHDEAKTSSKKDASLTPNTKSHHKPSIFENKNAKDSHSSHSSRRRSSITASSGNSAKIASRPPSDRRLSSPKEVLEEIEQPSYKTEEKESDRNIISPAQLSPITSQSPTASPVMNVDNDFHSNIKYPMAARESNDICDSNKTCQEPPIQVASFSEVRKSIESIVCDENKNDTTHDADKNNFVDIAAMTILGSGKDTTEAISPNVMSREDVVVSEYSNRVDGRKNVPQPSRSASQILSPVSCKDTEPNEKAFKTIGIPMTSANRSIFSPQQTNKDNSSELIDFGHDILSVDETVSDDSFGNTESIKPMSFSFSSDFFFKEDSTEDRGVKETQNLVEKLRMNLISKNPVGTAVENVEQSITDEPEQSILNPTDQSIDSVISISDTNTPDDKAEESNSHLSTQVCLSNSNNDDKSNDMQVADTNDTIIMIDDEKVSGSVEMDSREKWQLSENRAESQLHEESETNQEVPQNVTFNIESMRTQDHMNNPDIYMASQPKNLYPSEAITEMMVTNYHESSSMHNEMRERLRHEIAESRDRHELILAHNHLEMQNYTPGMLPECAGTNSPYNMSQQKWSESKILVRSPLSSSRRRSLSPRKSINVHNPETRDIIENTHPAHSGSIADEYHQPYHSMEQMSYNAFSSEASQFVNAPISMYPSAVAPSHMPLTSSGNLYLAHMPMNYASSVASLMSPVPKCPPPPHIPFSTLRAAAFTSSSHNIALTAAMVAPPSPKQVVEPSPRREENIDFTPPNTYRTNESPSTTSDSLSNSVPVMQLPASKEMSDTNVISPIEDLKSPTKITRTSARFVSRASESPSMSRSPERSPKQIDATSKSSSSSSSRRSTKSNRGQRGRGRSKGRGAPPQNYVSVDYLGNSIHSKLVGTVYELDLDDDVPKDGVDLKSMRERRRSIESHERKSEHSCKEASQSPQFTTKTPKPLHNKRTSYSSDNKKSRAVSPADEHQKISEPPLSPVEISSSESTTQASFTNIVQPVLPGPVDMRTYSSFEQPQNPESFSNHLLGAFASGTADQQLAEIDEDVEKELHSALMASKSTPEESSPAAPPNDAPLKVYIPPPSPKEIPLPKVSLSDSRNQLKVKIKGPFLDANYSTSSVQPVIPPPPTPTVEAVGFPIPSAVGSASAAMLAGTTNLRRMRKKELLRQYWTQDMNMDDPACSIGVGIVPPPVPPTPVSRSVITIPKAVASMTSFPTREDYKAVVDANMEKKKKKIPGAMPRELRHLDMHDELDMADDQYILNITTPVLPAIQHKRRGRAASKPIVPHGDIQINPTAPKLKIKIGNNFNISTSTPVGGNVFQFRPPKKRLSGIPKPSIEDLKRESMKFRRKVMADFEEGEKEEEQDLRPRSEKRKKKKEGKKRKSSSDSREMSISATGTTPKLIIRLARKKEDKDSSSVKERSYVVEDSALPAKKSKAPIADPFHYDPSAPDPLAIEPSCGPAKLTPIRLKLARSAEGSGYVMKDSGGRDDTNAGSSTSALANTPMSVSKHCEVR